MDLLQIGDLGVHLAHGRVDKGQLQMSRGHLMKPLEIAIATERVASQEKLRRS